MRFAALAAVVVLAGCGGGGGAGKTTSTIPAPPSPAGVPPALAGAADATPTRVVDGIQCAAGEQVAYHIHQHLAIYVGGKARSVPYGIGIGPPLQTQQTPIGPFVVSGTCFTWLHTHAFDGIIHVESPTKRVYTLGDFFDVWGQRLDAGHVGPATGRVTAFVNGRRVPGNPRAIKLTSFRVIQLDVGSPVVPFRRYRFPAGL